jgi:biotin transport system substrate-specific component
LKPTAKTLEVAVPVSSMRPYVLQAVAVGGFAVATALSAHVRIPLPFTPVPITLQTLVVLLAGLTLGPGGGAASQALYLGAGLLGLPVFAAGAGAVFGPTGGYLIGFVLAAAVAGVIARRRWDALGLALGFAAGIAVIYGCGVAWLCALTHQPVAGAIAVGVLPFLAGDALKLVAAVGLAKVARPAWRGAMRSALRGEAR